MKCEINQLDRYGGHPYCDKRARWWDQRSGYLACGEHKKKLLVSAREYRFVPWPEKRG